MPYDNSFRLGSKLQKAKEEIEKAEARERDPLRGLRGSARTKEIRRLILQDLHYTCPVCNSIKLTPKSWVFIRKGLIRYAEFRGYPAVCKGCYDNNRWKNSALPK